jgi:3,4-dihydroxy 2-butanone 4-phosphate synthase/GTP cyclohydrolase II
MFNTIEEALTDIKKGKMVIVVDDENRENEGDFIIPAELITPQSVNFMALYGRGLICAPLTQAYAEKLGLNPMVPRNEDSLGTAFTVSIDASNNISTGISASDRSHTLKLLTNTDSQATSFIRPGHIFPLIAKDGGVVERAGHTEAAVDLAILTGHKPVGVICEILNDDGSCARVPDLIILAKKYDLKLITIEDLITYKKNIDIVSNKTDPDILNKKETYENSRG